jgi:hypothetical protein
VVWIFLSLFAELNVIVSSLHMKLDIPPTNDEKNISRSYYMNDGQFIMVGSFKESMIRIYRSDTGALFRDIPVSLGGPSPGPCKDILLTFCILFKMV